MTSSALTRGVRCVGLLAALASCAKDSAAPSPDPPGAAGEAGPLDASAGGSAGSGGLAGKGGTAGAGASGAAGAAGGGGLDAGQSGAGGSGPVDGAAGASFEGGLDAPGNPCLGPPPALRLTEVATGFHRPVHLTTAPHDSSTLYVVEKWSKVGTWNGATRGVFLDIEPLVFGGGEAGVLSVAFHPQFGAGSERRFWVYYNRRTDLATVVSEFTATDATTADPGTEKPLVVVSQPSDHHNGGQIAFGPDGYLYISIGDGGPTDDARGDGQNAATRLSTILRVDVDAYPAPPPGNMAGAHPDVLHIGLRQPWRFSFDRATGDLYIADVGSKGDEEVNVVPAGSGPKNFGWSIMEGDDCFQSTACDQTGLTLPDITYPHPASNKAAVMGGFVYRGGSIPGLVGRYLYADYLSNQVWTFTWTGTGVCDEHELTADLDPQGLLDGVSSFGEDADGELYVLSYWNGTVYRIDAE